MELMNDISIHNTRRIKNQIYSGKNACRSVCHSLSDLKMALEGKDPDSVFVCGGEQIYRLLLPYCSEALVTLNYSCEPADTFFPNLNRLPNWRLTAVGEKQREGEQAFRYLSFQNTDPLPLPQR